jgi:predicted phosphoribosyltransferase
MLIKYYTSTVDIIVLVISQFFRAVVQVYENWCDVPDEEVIAIMENKKKTVQAE